MARTLAFTLVSVLLIGCGQILFKVAARDALFASFDWPTFVSWLTPAMIGALVVSTAATVLWVWVLQSATLSIVYPLYALTFVIVPVLDSMLFGSVMTARHWGGAAAIVGGVWLMSAANA
jgi:drug/metabolite transporter (DMT)-like permease